MGSIKTDASIHGYADPAPQHIDGAVTLNKLNAWIVTHRPDVALYEHNDTKGFYRVDMGPAYSFKRCGLTWRDVAATLGAIEVC